MQEAADAPTPSEVVTIPSAVMTAALDESLRGGDMDVNKKAKRLNYQNWKIAAIIYGCHAACVAKPQSTV
jgi:hypothetical protein